MIKHCHSLWQGLWGKSTNEGTKSPVSVWTQDSEIVPGLETGLQVHAEPLKVGSAFLGAAHCS